MKKFLLMMLVATSLVIWGCTKTPDDDQDDLPAESACKDTPLAEGCYVATGDLDFQSPIAPEFLIDETFAFEMLNQMPSNWLLYTNPEYKVNGVYARVVEMEGNRVLKMYSDGLQKPPYPQGMATPTFILTTKFNLDQTRAGIAYGSILIPSEEGNAVTMGLSTGAVNTIAVIIGRDMTLSVKIGGPFFYHSGSGDSGITVSTGRVLDKDVWHDFKFEWDAGLDEVKAYLIIDGIEHLLHQGPFHISNRFNAASDGIIMVPNVFRVTMPSGRNLDGFGYLDNVRVERKE